MRRLFRTRKQDKTKSIRFPVFANYEIKIVFTHDFEKSFKRFEYLKNEKPDKDVDGITCQVIGEGLTYIFIKYGSDTGTMAHEAYHAVCNLLRDRNAELSDEVVAYHLGYLVNKIEELALK